MSNKAIPCEPHTRLLSRTHLTTSYGHPVGMETHAHLNAGYHMPPAGNYTYMVSTTDERRSVSFILTVIIFSQRFPQHVDSSHTSYDQRFHSALTQPSMEGYRAFNYDEVCNCSFNNASRRVFSHTMKACASENLNYAP